MAKNKYIFTKTRVIVFLIIAAILGVSMIFAGTLEKYINFSATPMDKGSLEDIQEDDLTIHFVYVGQGDSTIIELPNGEVMMIDSGPRSAKTELNDYLDKVIFEDDRNIIDYFILTHTDEDHTGGAVMVFENYDVKAVYRPEVYSKSEIVPDGEYQVTTTVWDNAVKAMVNAEEINIVEKDMKIEYTDSEHPSKSWSFTFFGPIADVYSNNNDYSPVMVLENNGKKYMFTGDASEDIEKEFLDAYSTRLSDFDVDVLKVGHHGSSSSTCEEFLAVVKPEIAVISCGKDNKYGHPTNDLLARLEDAKAQILRTDVSSSIIIYGRDGTLKHVADFFEPNDYYIEWWYVVVTLGVIAAVICFFPKSEVKRLAKQEAREAKRKK